MICAIAFHPGDVHRAVDLLEWIKLLGKVESHQALLISDASVQWSQALQCLSLAQGAFQSAEIITVEPPRQGWPMASNAMFLAAAHHLAGQPFFWCEPDCIPLQLGWLDALQSEYVQHGKPFLGALVRCSQVGLPPISLGGCAVYPPDAAQRLRAFCSGARAWDVASAEAVVPLAAETKRIQWFWGQPQLPPSFAAVKTPDRDVNVFTDKSLDAKAVVFHRNKDGSLIRLLWKRAFPEVLSDQCRERELSVVFPFCNKDEKLMDKTMRWNSELFGKQKRTAILHYDSNVNRPILDSVQRWAELAFSRVVLSRYPTPKFPFIGWPAACNWAFRQACDFMENRLSGSWFWFEADAVALHPEWLGRIEEEYRLGGKPFMGTVIGDFDGLKMGHINGTAVYPWNAARYFPRALSNPGYPWDAGMRDEMIEYAHRGNHIMQHCGAVLNGCCKPANGPQAKFPTHMEVAKLLEPGCVFFHPNKDGSLIDRLRERRNR